MLLKTILNRVEKFKSFVYKKVELIDNADGVRIDVHIEPRRNGRPVCSGCKEIGPCYDHLPSRRFQYVPLWGIAVFFIYAMRRVNCPNCGVKVEAVPWGDGKSQLTTTFSWFLATWAKRLCWKETALAFNTTWEKVFRSVKHAVLWGLAHRDTNEIEAIGVDEVQWKRGHKYLTLVYQINDGAKRLLWIAQDRTEESLRRFFRILTDQTRQGIRFAASDMWQPYLKVIQEQAGDAIHVLDRFHIMSTMNKAIDQVRREETNQLKADGYEPVLKHSRWALLKRKENLTDKQTVKLSELLQYNLRSVKAHLLREDFQQFWEYTSPYWAGVFLDQWCTRTMRSGLEPMKRVARSLRSHRELILNWFRAEGVISSGIVEGFNTKVKLTVRKSYGFRTPEAAEIALYHTLGNLPEPELTHEFC